MAGNDVDDTNAPRRAPSSLAKLGRDADAGFDAAIESLTDEATKLGIDPDDHATFTELAHEIRKGRRNTRRITGDPSTDAPPTFCMNCGNALGAGWQFCGVCGARRDTASATAPTVWAPPAAAKTSGLAIAALVLGAVPLFGVGNVLGIILGVLAKRNIERSNGTRTGTSFANAGIALGSIWILLFLVAIPTFRGANARHSFDNYIKGKTPATEFSAVDAGFRATFPTTPKRTTQPVSVPGQSITLTNYTSESPDRAFQVGEFSFAPGTPFDLNGAVKGAAQAVNGTVLSSQMTLVQGHNAAEFVISAMKNGQMYLKGAVIYTSTRAYFIIVGARENPPQGYERFKASLLITG